MAKLVSNFGDPDVGAVSGELVLGSSLGHEGRDGVGLYWRIEKWIRRKEAEIDSVIGATGAIYAIRRELFKPLASGAILDDALSRQPIRCIGGQPYIIEDRHGPVLPVLRFVGVIGSLLSISRYLPALRRLDRRLLDAVSAYGIAD